MKKQIVAVIDFGSQYTQLIARRVRELNVYSEIFPHSITASELKKMGAMAVILSGGPSSVYENAAPQVENAILDLNIPVLGICYGLHLMILKAGGQVIHKGHGEYGFAQVHSEVKSPLLDGAEVVDAAFTKLLDPKIAILPVNSFLKKFLFVDIFYLINKILISD